MVCYILCVIKTELYKHLQDIISQVLLDTTLTKTEFHATTTCVVVLCVVVCAWTELPMKQTLYNTPTLLCVWVYTCVKEKYLFFSFSPPLSPLHTLFHLFLSKEIHLEKALGAFLQQTVIRSLSTVWSWYHSCLQLTVHIKPQHASGCQFSIWCPAMVSPSCDSTIQVVHHWVPSNYCVSELDPLQMGSMQH